MKRIVVMAVVVAVPGAGWSLISMLISCFIHSCKYLVDRCFPIVLNILELKLN